MYILFDIGGTNTRVAGTRDLETIGEVIKFDTPHSFLEGIKKIKETGMMLAKGERVEAAVGGIRGPLSSAEGTIESDTVLTDWVKKPIREALEDALGTPVELYNDAALVALGEANFGAGKGYNIVAYHTVSTGVGGARVVGGKLDESHTGGFEPGHQIIDADRTLLDTAFSRSESDTLEELVSGGAIEKRYGKKPYEIPQSDPVWDELARWLAYGLKNTLVYWSPDIIVLGGSMIVGDPRILREDIERHLTEVVGGLEAIPPVVDATLGDSGGLYGGLAVLKVKKR